MAEIINPNQTMEFFDLNPDKGLINIGSNPENDIVINDPKVMPFHMMIDVRQQPYLVVGLDPNAEITVDGNPLPENGTAEIMDLSQVRIGDYSLNMISKNGDNAIKQIAVLSPEARENLAAKTTPIISSQPTMIPPIPSSVRNRPDFGSSSSMFIPTSDVILVEPHEQKQTINVEQTAIYPFTIINAGTIVASFEVHVEGVPAEWVKIIPERVNLYEGGRANIEVHITPPRNSASRAGDYSVLVKVGSSNYPGQFSGVRVDLTINPYYEYAVDNLDPRFQKVSWGKNIATSQYHIKNQGNSLSNYLVMAQDDENGCKFEFEVGENESLAKQAEISVEPGQVRAIPIHISPIKRNLVRLRSKQYQYSITTQSMNENASSRIVSGSLSSRPLFGLFSILLAIILILLSAFFILRPRIIDFSVVEDVIALGDPAILNWKVTPFTTNLRIEGINQEISGSQNQVEVVPTDTAETFTLVAGNWLSRLLRMDDVRSDPITVLAIPPSPQISTFFVDKTKIFEGDDITIKWSVSDADEVFLTVDGVRNSLSPDEFNSERTVTLRNDSLIVLEAKNDSGSIFQSEYVQAQKPTINIEEFTLSDTTIIRGESVTIKWKVSGIGVENVQIAPFEEVYPLEGELTFFPTESMEFVLTVKNRDLEEIKLLPVGVLEPGADPVPPTVEFFKVAPEEITGSDDVEFSWSVSGISDRIEISSIDGVILAGLPAQGFMSYNVTKTTSYVLTAYNGDLSSAAILEVKVNPTKKNVVITIDKIVPSTAIYRGDSVMVYYSVDPATSDNVIVDAVAMGWPEISGTVVVTDGFDTCDPVELPVHACELTLNTTEKNKQIYATYSGDDNYVRRTSDPYPVGLDVIGETVTFKSFGYSSETIVVGQSTTVSFELAPDNPNATNPVSGKVKVQNGDTTLCISTLTASITDPMNATGQCLLTFTDAGTEYLTLVYEGNDIYDGKTASLPALTINQGQTRTDLFAIWAFTTVVGQSFPVDVIVGPLPPASGVPTGQVIVMDKDAPTDKCTVTLDSIGRGNCNLLLHNVGTRNIYAEYVGDENFIASDSIIFAHPVVKANTATKITSFTPTTTSVGQEVLVKYQVQVVSPGSGVPTGTVTITVGNGNGCVGDINTSGVGECAVLLTKAGVQPVIASYSGDSSFNSSIGSGYSYPVTVAETKTTISTPDPSPSAIGDTVKVSFTVALSQTSSINPSGPARVQASTGENCITTVVNGSGTCNLTFAIEGTRTIKVFYLGTTDFASSESVSITHIVVRASNTYITGSTLNPVIDQPVNITFSVQAATPGGGIPTGDVTVKADTGETCSGTLTNGTGNCSITFSKSGTKTLTATYSGNTEYKTSTSVPYPIIIAKASTTTLITSDLSATKTVGDTINVAVTVSSNISATPTGNVTVTIIGSTDSRETCTFSLSAGSGNCNLILVKSGLTRQVQATYEGTTDRFASSTSQIVPIRVDAGPTTTSITSDSPDPSNVNQAVTFTVQVRATKLDSLRPTGTFSVVLVGTPDKTLCTGTLNPTTSEGTCQYTFSAQGDKTIKAVYTGTSDYLTSTSQNITHTVNKADTTTSINIATNPSVLNETVAVNVTVASVGSSVAVPSGTVSVTASKSGNTSLTCSITLNISGTGSCNITPNDVGDWTVKADYSGDANFNTSTNSVTQTVNKVESVTTMTLPTGGSIIGQAFDVNVSVAKPASAPGSGTLGGSVTVTATMSGQTDKTCTIPDISSGTGTCSLTLGFIGDWTITAAYSGNDDFKSSQTSATHTVNKVPTKTTITSISPAPSVTGQSIAISVKVERDGITGLAPTGTVNVSAVLSGITKTCTVTLNSGIGSCSLTPTASGNWTVTAAYQGTATTYDTSSVSTTQQVNSADTTTTLTVPTSTIVVGQIFSVSATVTANSPGSGTPTGIVKVTASNSGTIVNCSADIDLSTQAKSCNLTLPRIGVWVITATYQGDGNYKTSIDTKNLTINQAATTTAITNMAANNIFIQNLITVSYDVNVTPPGGGTPTGIVNVTATIKITGTTYTETCSASVATGKCDISLSQSGTWSVTAVYAGDTNFITSTSTTSSYTYP